MQKGIFGALGGTAIAKSGLVVLALAFTGELSWESITGERLPSMVGGYIGEVTGDTLLICRSESGLLRLLAGAPSWMVSSSSSSSRLRIEPVVDVDSVATDPDVEMGKGIYAAGVTSSIVSVGCRWVSS